MNGKNIKKHLNNKLRDWILNIDDENIKKMIKREKLTALFHLRALRMKMK